MMRNLLNGLRLGFAYFSVGTVIAQVVIVAVIFWKWGLTAEKYTRLMAHFRGVNTVKLIAEQGKLAKAEGDAKTNNSESLVSMRNKALEQGIGKSKISESLFSGNQKQYDTVRAIFKKRLDELEATKVIEARETVIETLEALDPELTKDLILLMIEDVGAKEVGEILDGMPKNRKTKIYAEFTTPEEEKVLNTIFKALRSKEVTPASDEGEAL